MALFSNDDDEDDESFNFANKNKPLPILGGNKSSIMQ